MFFAFLAVGFKFMTTFVVFSNLFRLPGVDAISVAVGLAQISEFSFVVASRGKKHGIVSRETYFLMLGTTTLTLLVTPILFKISRFRKHQL